MLNKKYNRTKPNRIWKSRPVRFYLLVAVLPDCLFCLSDQKKQFWGHLHWGFFSWLESLKLREILTHLSHLLFLPFYPWNCYKLLRRGAGRRCYILVPSYHILDNTIIRRDQINVGKQDYLHVHLKTVFTRNFPCALVQSIFECAECCGISNN